MAYMNQTKKALLAPKIKAVLKKYGMQGSIAIRNHSSLVVNIRKGKLDIFGNALEVATQKGHADRANPDATNYSLCHSNQISNFSGKVADFFTELHDAMMEGNHNRSDAMTDYFDVGWYIDINIGKWDRPYEVV